MFQEPKKYDSSIPITVYMQLQINEAILTNMKMLREKLEKLDKNQTTLWDEVFYDEETPSGLGINTGTNNKKRWEL